MKTRLKEAYTALKSSSGQEKIEKILFDSISRPGVDNALRAEGYYVCALLEQSINEDLNQKAYLKQKLDTLRLFKSVYMMYDYVLMCDSVDLQDGIQTKVGRSWRVTVQIFLVAASFC